MVQKTLRRRAMDILARREISRADLKRKLAPYAESEEEVETVLDEFARQHWQSDERFAESYINSKSRLYGRQRMKQALAAKGIDEEVCRDLLPAYEEELENAKQVLRKKFKQAPATYQEKQKHIRFLHYRGFTLDIAFQAFRAVWQDSAIDEYETY